MKNLFLLICGIPKTLIINFKLLSFKEAVKFPIIVSSNTKFRGLKGKVNIKGEVKTGAIIIGFSNMDLIDVYKESTVLKINGTINFYGRAFIGTGSSINVDEKGVLTLGENFKISAKSKIYCNNNIEFGKNCLVSWENLFMDTDFHKIYEDNNILLNKDRNIVIGDNVWIGCRCTILKNSNIKDGTIVSSNSLINKEYDEGNCVLGGIPAKKIKTNVRWEK